MEAHEELCRRFACDLPVTALFEYPTIEALARLLQEPATAGRGPDVADRARRQREAAARRSFPEEPWLKPSRSSVSPAVSPGRARPATLWRNVLAGVESIRTLSDDELRAAGIAEETLRDPRYVKARAILDGADLFDAPFFGIHPREAELMDPQHRIFLEVCQEALEDAGLDPRTFPGLVGVYAGSSVNTYLASQVAPDRAFLRAAAEQFQVGAFPVLFGNDGHFLTTRLSYKLNLRGPSVDVQTACSTSLVAVSLACRSLLHYECDAALAGGVSVSFPQFRGYLYLEGGMVSADGHCRTFDAKADGTVFGSGAGVVVLKRLSDALESRDRVLAVIRGFAVNNDGAAERGVHGAERRRPGRGHRARAGRWRASTRAPSATSRRTAPRRRSATRSRSRRSRRRSARARPIGASAPSAP